MLYLEQKIMGRFLRSSKNCENRESLSPAKPSPFMVDSESYLAALLEYLTVLLEYLIFSSVLLIIFNSGRKLF